MAPHATSTTTNHCTEPNAKKASDKAVNLHIDFLMIKGMKYDEKVTQQCS